MARLLLRLSLLAALAGSVASGAVPTPPAELAAVPVALPGGEGGIGFDDLGFSTALDRVIVPAGRTGDLDLVDPTSGGVTSVPGFGTAPAGARGAHGHGEGSTSADFGHGLLFAVDHDGPRLVVIDPAAHRIVASTQLAADPDYVRWVAPTGEIWVTEPEAEAIEIFRPAADTSTGPQRVGTVPVPGGPEALVVDTARGRAYTNLWRGTTIVLDLARRSEIARWRNGCRGSRGLALDPDHGWLFVACAEGAARVLDAAHDGAVLDSFAHGSGVDIIAYDAARSLLILPGARSASLAVLRVGDGGALSLLATAVTAAGAHCVTVDDRHQAWVCDPDRGRLLRIAIPGS